jgi:hypothetical protein
LISKNLIWNDGSAAINFAVHYKGMDIRTNFNIYGLDFNTGRFKVLWEGFKDQQSFYSTIVDAKGSNIAHQRLK